MRTKTDDPIFYDDERAHANPDPLTGQPGSHPVGTGLGAAGAAAAGAALGAAAGGPVGALVGGVVGAVAGGAAGHAAGEAFDPTVETSYWRENYTSRPYYRKGTSFSDYEPAYRYGWEKASSPLSRDRSFDDLESTFEQEWEIGRGESSGDWTDARDAARDAWNRVRERGGQTTASGATSTKATADTLNSLLRGELAAVATYEKALQAIDGATASEGDELLLFAADHRRSVETLKAAVSAMGCTPDQTPGVWGAVTNLVQGSADILGDRAAVQSLLEGEEHGLKEYEQALDSLPPDVRRVIQQELLPRQRKHIAALSDMRASMRARA